MEDQVDSFLGVQNALSVSRIRHLGFDERDSNFSIFEFRTTHV